MPPPPADPRPLPENPDDQVAAALARAVAGGDREALARLYDLYAPRVYAVALRVLGRPPDAEAVVSDVFLGLWENPSRFDASRGPLRAYLVLMARSRAIDRLRAAATRAQRTEGAATAAPGERAARVRDSRPEAPLVDQENRDRVHAAVRRLDPKQRTPLEMAFFEGLTHTEIADRLGEPLGTIKTRIRTALATLRSALQPSGRDRDSLP